MRTYRREENHELRSFRNAGGWGKSWQKKVLPTKTVPSVRIGHMHISVVGVLIAHLSPITNLQISRFLETAVDGAELHPYVLVCSCRRYPAAVVGLVFR